MWDIDLSLDFTSSIFFFFLMIRRPPRSTLFPSRRSSDLERDRVKGDRMQEFLLKHRDPLTRPLRGRPRIGSDRKSTRLNSSHSQISYAVFCLKKKKNIKTLTQ